MTIARIARILGSALVLVSASGGVLHAEDLEDSIARRIHKTVRAVRLDPQGRTSGVILSDGTQYVGVVNDNLMTVAKQGDPVRVELGSGDRLVLINEFTNEGATIGPRPLVDLQPFYPYAVGGGPRDENRLQYQNRLTSDAADLGRFAVVGKVELVLKSPTGAPEGLLMDDGTQVHVLPRVSDVVARFRPGDELRVEGKGTRGVNGNAMWAVSITKDRTVFLDLERGQGAPEIGIVARSP
ncbi:MAG: hypothetical protein ACXVEF_35810 [Polyangiales bacterium]